LEGRMPDHQRPWRGRGRRQVFRCRHARVFEGEPAAWTRWFIASAEDLWAARARLWARTGPWASTGLFRGPHARVFEGVRFAWGPVAHLGMGPGDPDLGRDQHRFADRHGHHHRGLRPARASFDGLGHQLVISSAFLPLSPCPCVTPGRCSSGGLLARPGFPGTSGQTGRPPLLTPPLGAFHLGEHEGKHELTGQRSGGSASLEGHPDHSPCSVLAGPFPSRCGIENSRRVRANPITSSLMVVFLINAWTERRL
jgi:hypothetical protein